MDENNIIAPDRCDPALRSANFFQAVAGRQNWPHHDVGDLELVLVVDGVYTARDTHHDTTRLERGDVVLIRAGRPCDLLYASGSPAVISCIHFELVAGLRYAQGDYIFNPDLWVVRTGGDWQVVDLFRKCAALMLSNHAYAKEIANAVLKEIWLRLAAYARGGGAGGLEDRMRQMTAFIREHLAQPITRRDIAQEFGLTPEYVNLIFKRQLGITPGELIRRERVREAVRLLRTGHYRIGEIGQKVGYPDPLHFSRVFKQVTNVSPKNYRSP